MSDCTIAALRGELFDTLHKLKNNRNINVAPKERCTIEEAAAVCAVAKEITETFKVQVQALGLLAKSESPDAVQRVLISSGISEK